MTRIRVSDYIAGFLRRSGVEHVFTVVGGGAMHLNDSLGHCEGLNCVYVHHEQAAAIAAECYYRVNNKLPAVCVTTGPGGTNALTGVVGAWLDSVPMLVISGQVRYDTTARSTGLGLRAMGDQEFDITKAVDCMTKFSVMVENPEDIRYNLERALFEALNGRPGPVWLDIPLNVQGAYIDADSLKGFVPGYTKNKISPALADEIISRIESSSRPVLNVGNAVRLAGAFGRFGELKDALGIPVVTGWNSIDLIADSDPLYAGRAGIMGDRAGNFAVQNSDLLLSIGSRLSIRQVGYNRESWARESFVIMNDIDENELKKPTIHVELPVCADCGDFIDALLTRLSGRKLERKNDWLRRCLMWRKRYPVVTPAQLSRESANVYAFIKILSSSLSPGTVTVAGNGSASVVGSHAYVIKENSRFILNSAIASMGYDLPAAVGACFALGKKELVCVTGDGSIQMNLQELQTVVHHRLPIKLFVINNGGYHSIRQTQHKFFGEPLVGIGEESGDLSFPSMEKLSAAYGLSYISAKKNSELADCVKKALGSEGPFVCEVFVDTEQSFEPKAASKVLANGNIVSAPLEELAPFLSEEELRSNMIIEGWENDKTE